MISKPSDLWSETLSGFKYLPRECERCHHTLDVEEIHCPHCGDDGGFRFPIAHAVGVAVLVAGAIAYHYYPEFGAALLRLSGNDALLPE
jgi:uncharacterized paraquat-inducible protein A